MPLPFPPGRDPAVIHVEIPLAAFVNIQNPAAREKFTLAFVILACSVAILRTLFIHSFDGPWVPVQDMMNFTADPPWNHRVLFVWVGNAVRTAFPEASAFQAYFASQVLATFLALVFVTRFVSRFVVPMNVWMAPVLLTLILLPTLTYRTFFDIGIVAVFALGLDLLFRGKLYGFLVLIALGTLNHEITLFLIPLFLLLYFDRAPSKLWLAGWTVLQLIVYVGVRLALQTALPSDALWQGGKLSYNLGLFTGMKPALVFGVGSLIFWFLLGGLGWTRVTPLLRRCVWLLPLIVAEVVVFGQLNEPRQFDAFFPILVAIILQGRSASPIRVEIPAGGGLPADLDRAESKTS